jgi:hypothetical protein
MQFSRYSVQELPAQTTSFQIVADGNILRKNTPIKHQFHLSKLVNVPSGAKRNLNSLSALRQGFLKNYFFALLRCWFAMTRRSGLKEVRGKVKHTGDSQDCLQDIGSPQCGSFVEARYKRSRENWVPTFLRNF